GLRVVLHGIHGDRAATRELSEADREAQSLDELRVGRGLTQAAVQVHRRWAAGPQNIGPGGTADVVDADAAAETELAADGRAEAAADGGDDRGVKSGESHVPRGVAQTYAVGEALGVVGNHGEGHRHCPPE